MNNYIDDELKRVRQLQSSNWDSVRSVENYRLESIDYPFGKRFAYTCKIDKKSYEDLQCSRGIVCAEDIDALITKLPFEMVDADIVRIEELNKYINCQKDEFYEIGFRFPRLLKYYSNIFKTVKGCDVVDLNVAVGKRLGYNVEKCDISETVPDLSTANLVVAYHVLEHVSFPHLTIKNMFDSMTQNSFAHIEIPIEPGIPRLRYAHLFAFDKGDLIKMCTSVGFKIIAQCNLPWNGGPEIERVLVQK